MPVYNGTIKPPSQTYWNERRYIQHQAHGGRSINSGCCNCYERGSPCHSPLHVAPTPWARHNAGLSDSPGTWLSFLSLSPWLSPRDSRSDDGIISPIWGSLLQPLQLMQMHGDGEGSVIHPWFPRPHTPSHLLHKSAAPQNQQTNGCQACGCCRTTLCHPPKFSRLHFTMNHHGFSLLQSSCQLDEVDAVTCWQMFNHWLWGMEGWG